jgi:hypothetical protein
MINFIIPVKHTGLIQNKKKHKEYLAQLIKSIVSQEPKIAKVWLVCPSDYEIGVGIENYNIDVIRLDRDMPNQDYAANNIKKYFQQFRIDKGSKIYEVYKKLDTNDWIIPLDDDDIIRNDYINTIKSIHDSFFVIKKGYKWYPESRCLIKLDKFDSYCGTSIGFKKSVIKKYETYDDFIEILGSHNLLKKYERKYIEINKRLVLWRLENLNSSQELLNAKKNMFGKIKFFVRECLSYFGNKRIRNKKYEKIISEFQS